MAEENRRTKISDRLSIAVLEGSWRDGWRLRIVSRRGSRRVFLLDTFRHSETIIIHPDREAMCAEVVTDRIDANDNAKYINSVIKVCRSRIQITLV